MMGLLHPILIRRHLLFGLIAAIACIPTSMAWAAQDGDRLTYEKDIRPILRAHCLDCHGATQDLEGELDLRQVRLMLIGGDGGPAIEPGNADNSYLVQRLWDGEMPPGSAKVPAEEIKTIADWIDQGATTLRPEPEDIPPGIGLTPEERDYWFFKPLTRPDAPKLSASDVVHPIDQFIVAKLASRDLALSPVADRATLVKRAYFDLIGLPPTYEEVQAFVNDTSPDAYENLIDRLLDSPHYGERWGRHWLDVAGYADSEGYTNADRVRSWAYFYRDYVIRSFNDDKPFDQFMIEQLAGDELVPPPHTNLPSDQLDKLVATGFLRMAADGTGQGGDQAAARNQTVADTIKIMGSGLLGLSVGCAQCHDHRYDPILQEDYYRLRAIFEPALNWQDWKTPDQRKLTLYTDQDRADAAKIEEEAQAVQKQKNEKQAQFLKEALDQELENYESPLREQLRTAYETPAAERSEADKKLLAENPAVNISPGVLYQYNQAAADELKKLDQQMAEIRSKKKPEQFVRVLIEPEKAVPTTQVFHRGDHRQPTQEVQPGELTVLFGDGERSDFEGNVESVPTTGRRLAFAKSLVSGRHPLFNRTMMNRVWMHHFGIGIVATPGEFGRLGEAPSHPELLDWLACEFADSGWSLKHMHRLIMTSDTYRQQSRTRPQGLAIDQDNRLLWRYSVRRLEAEAIRDRILTSSGALADTMFGPPVGVKEDDTGQVIAQANDRRSIYLQVRRSQPLAFLQAFDAPIMETNCEKRSVSTVAPQALIMLNSQFLLDQAERMAVRVASNAATEVEDSVVAQFGDQAEPPKPVWEFGYGLESDGEYSFKPLPHWTGSAWQGGPQLPDPALNWCLLTAEGGHPGDQYAVIRRWTAPTSGDVIIEGTLSHASEHGDGVRGQVVSSTRGIIGEFLSAHSDISTPVSISDVEVGEQILFVVDGRTSVTSDSFRWPIEVSIQNSGGKQTYPSKDHFHGPTVSIAKQVIYAWQLAYQRSPDEQEYLSTIAWLERQINQELGEQPRTKAVKQAMTNLCQSLLGSNEFLYVD